MSLVAAEGYSSFFSRDTNTTIAINLTPGTHDINFYVTSPDWYQYVAIGIGNAMEDALILVMYASKHEKSAYLVP